MAAGQGFKTFTTGEVLTAADTNGYLMQGVLVFATSVARDAAITSPQEGQFAYLKDTNVTTYYTGSAWANLDTTGMTNPMTTTGDTIYSSSGSTPARLGIGTTGQVLTVAAGLPSWAAAPSGSLTISQIATGTFNSGTSFTVSSLSSYDTITMIMNNVSVNSAAGLSFRINNNSGTNYVEGGWRNDLSRYDYNPTGDTGIYAGNCASSNQFNSITLRLENCKATGFTNYFMTSIVDGGTKQFQNIQGVYKVAEAVSSLVFLPTAGSFNASASYTIYGG
jgi:hypothetical protein